ncbi:hypothetical protein [Natrinema pallidum]|uniref:Uncharacterized protein n=1 Tax=Natrinema pallidum TaxID=69527 RepID=A0A4P9THH5_9EURY|nr:hypothetical protein [Natrinema pallidum]QCW03565.1 hypothetical protein FGF80_10075 [Natrinema pallidum]
MSENVTVRLTEDGPARMRGNGETWERGDTREVTPERAEALLETHDYIEIVDENETDRESSDLADKTHDELKEIAEGRGIADEIDLRSKESIIDALEG